MTRAALASILVLSLAVPATADVTITQVGGMSATTTVTEVGAGPLADALFAVPAGYKVKERR